MARTFPPTQLEWRATQEKASMALDVGCFNGELSSPHHELPSLVPLSLQRGHWSQQAPVRPRDQEMLGRGPLGVS